MDIANADVAMVLDVTGSMDGHMRMSSSSSATESRLSALQKSVKAFYDALGPGRAGGDLSKGRIRYGFVPYGTVVNAGYLLTHDQMVDSHTYQSREAIHKTVYGWTETGSESDGNYGKWSEPTGNDATELLNLGSYNSWGTGTVGTSSTPGTLYAYTKFNGDTAYLNKTLAATQAECPEANTFGGNLIAAGYNSTASQKETNVELAPVHPAQVRNREYTDTRTINVIGFRYAWVKVDNKSACRLTSATGKSATRFTQVRTKTTSKPVEWTEYTGTQFEYYPQRQIDVSGLKGLFGAWNSTIAVPRLNRTGSTQTYYDVKLSGSNSLTTVVVGGTPEDAQVTWRGCVEERQMDPTITEATSITTIPANAYDLNTNLPADRNDDATRWRPWIHSLVYQPGSSNQEAAERDCPSPALKLQEIGSYNDTIIESNYPNLFDDASGGASSFYYPYVSGSSNRWKNDQTIRNYIDRVRTTDGTLHDAGFIWGLHLVSGEGMFAGENPDRFNGQLVSRNIVFMTDGEMNPGEERYVFSGYNKYDGRLAPTNTSDANMKKVHNRRLRILCEAAKRQGITVWVVVITDNTTQDYSDLRACASSSGNYKSAATSQELIASFTTIAQSIGGLRISQ
jgi:hypothetical protein